VLESAGARTSVLAEPPAEREEEEHTLCAERPAVDTEDTDLLVSFLVRAPEVTSLEASLEAPP
jgi:hypothetical protein